MPTKSSSVVGIIKANHNTNNNAIIHENNNSLTTPPSNTTSSSSNTNILKALNENSNDFQSFQIGLTSIADNVKSLNQKIVSMEYRLISVCDSINNVLQIQSSRLDSIGNNQTELLQKIIMKTSPLAAAATATAATATSSNTSKALLSSSSSLGEKEKESVVVITPSPPSPPSSPATITNKNENVKKIPNKKSNSSSDKKSKKLNVSSPISSGISSPSTSSLPPPLPLPLPSPVPLPLPPPVPPSTKNTNNTKQKITNSATSQEKKSVVISTPNDTTISPPKSSSSPSLLQQPSASSSSMTTPISTRKKLSSSSSRDKKISSVVLKKKNTTSTSSSNTSKEDEMNHSWYHRVEHFNFMDDGNGGDEFISSTKSSDKEVTITFSNEKEQNNFIDILNINPVSIPIMSLCSLKTLLSEMTKGRIKRKWKDSTFGDRNMDRCLSTTISGEKKISINFKTMNHSWYHMVKCSALTDGEDHFLSSIKSSDKEVTITFSDKKEQSNFIDILKTNPVSISTMSKTTLKALQSLLASGIARKWKNSTIGGRNMDICVSTTFSGEKMISINFKTILNNNNLDTENNSSSSSTFVKQQQQQRIPRKMGKKCRPIEIDKNEMNLSSKEKCCQLVGEDGDEGTKGILVKITVGKDGSMDCKGNNVNSNKNKGEDKSGILVRGLRRKRPHHQTYTTINNDTDNVDSNIGSVVICKKDDVSFEKISNVDPDTACISSPGIIISSPQSPPTTSTNNYDDNNGDNNTKQQSPKKILFY